MVGTVYTIAMSTEITNHEQLFSGKRGVRFLGTSGHNSSLSEDVTLLYVCLCRKTLYSMYIVESLSLNSWPAVCDSGPRVTAPSHTHTSSTSSHNPLPLGAWTTLLYSTTDTWHTLKSPTKPRKCKTKARVT